MRAKLGRLLARIGGRLLGIGEQLLEAPPAIPTTTAVPADRPMVNFDSDSLSAAFAVLAAVERSDVTAYHVITKHSDPLDLTLALVFAVGDALAEPSSTDVAGYCDELFDRLARR